MMGLDEGKIGRERGLGAAAVVLNKNRPLEMEILVGVGERKVSPEGGSR